MEMADVDFFASWCMKFKLKESTKAWLLENGCDCDSAIKHLTKDDIPIGPDSGGVENLGERIKILTGVSSLQTPTSMCFRMYPYPYIYINIWITKALPHVPHVSISIFFGLFSFCLPSFLVSFPHTFIIYLCVNTPFFKKCMFSLSLLSFC